jgi:bile acid:Na+ symporter, BASS family
METSLALNVGLPIALCIIMLGLGLSLRLDDFIAVLARPKPVIIGLACQLLILPTLCLLLVLSFDLPPSISVGMMLLAASPAGTSAVLYTHLARGDVALSITLAALTSLVVVITMPIVANMSMELFFGETATVRLEFLQVLQIFLIAVVPALIGVAIRSRRPELAERLDKPVKLMATLFLAAVVVFALVGQWHLVGVWGPVAGGVALAHNLVSLSVGYCLPRILGVARRQAIAIAMSMGIHNAAIVITVAMSEYMLDDAEMAVPPAIYGIIAYITCAAFVWLLNRRHPETAPGRV